MTKVLIIGGIALLVVVIVVFLILGNINTIVKKGVERTGPVVLKAPVTLKDVNISIFSGSGKLEGFTVGNPQGYQSDYAFRLESLGIDLDPSSVTSDTIHIKNIIIDSPAIMFEGGFQKNNLKQLQENARAYSSGGREKKEASKASQGKKLLIDSIKIQNANVGVSMGIIKAQKLTVALPTLELKDIGKEKDADISDVIEAVLKVVNSAVIPAVQSGVSDYGKDLMQRGESLKEDARKEIDKIKGLFGK